MAETPDLVWFDRLAGCRNQPHLFVAIADQNAGYRDRGTSVCCRCAKSSAAALIMHLPFHLRNIHDFAGSALIQVNSV